MFDVTYNLNRHDALLLSCRTTRTSPPHLGPFHPETYDLSPSPSTPIDALLSAPILVELWGDRFEIPRGRQDYVLRTPRVRKVYLDRDWRDGISREELQTAAKLALVENGGGGEGEVGGGVGGGG